MEFASWILVIISSLLLVKVKYLKKLKINDFSKYIYLSLTLIILGRLYFLPKYNVISISLLILIIGLLFLFNALLNKKDVFQISKVAKICFNLSYKSSKVIVLPYGAFHYFTKFFLFMVLLSSATFENQNIALSISLFSTGSVYGLLYFIFSNRKQKVDVSGAEIDSINEALTNLSPKIVFYFSAANEQSLFHIHMWLEYIKQLNIPFYIIVRERTYLKKLTSIIKDVPILCITKLTDLDQFIPSSVVISLYANNGTKNTHFIRFNEITHIQLLHGESEKPPSYNPISKMYDYLFVCGQRAQDRYEEQNVAIPKKSFVQIGRPQIDEIQTSIVQKMPNDKINILIAPTWLGYYQDTQFSSFLVIKTFIEKLLKRKEDYSITLRLHPLIDLESQQLKAYIKEVKGLLSSFEGSVFDSKNTIINDFNASDFILTDISSVPIDYLVSEKPIVQLDVNLLSDKLNSEVKYEKYKEAIYLIKNDFSNTDDILDDVLYKDSKKAVRASVTKYYHGENSTRASVKFINAINTVSLKNGDNLLNIIQNELKENK